MSDLDAIETDQPIVLIAGDGHHGWLNTTALHVLALPTREDVVTRASGSWPTGGSPRCSAPTAPAPTPTAARWRPRSRRRVVGLVDLEFSGGVADWVERWDAAPRPAPHPPRLLRRRPRRRAGPRAALGRPARRRPAADDGPLKIISDGSLNTGPPGAASRTPRRRSPASRRASPTRPPRSCARCSPGPRPAASTSRCTRSATAPSPRRWPPSPTPAPGAGSSTSSSPRATTYAGCRARRPGERPAGPPARRPRRHRAAVARPRGALCFPLRWMLDDGVEVALGSDAPVSPLDPWLAVAPPRCTAGRRARAGSGTPSSRSPRARRSPPRPTAGAPSRSATGRPGLARRRPARRHVRPRPRRGPARLRRPRPRRVGRGGAGPRRRLSGHRSARPHGWSGVSGSRRTLGGDE